MKQESMSIKRPDVNKLKELSQEVNSIPLPNIPDTRQILLPPQEHSLMRNNFQVYTEDLMKHFNVNMENPIERNERASEKASFIHEGDDQKKKGDDVARPVQTVLRRKKNREIKISLDLGKKKDLTHEENDINMTR